MSRPKGSVNKPKSIQEPVQVEKFIPPVTLTVSQPIHYDVIFGIRCHKTGQWKGQNLWELVKLSTDGQRSVLIDASSRTSVINYVVRQIGKIVVI